MTLVAPPQVLGSTYPRLFTPPLVTGAPGPCGCGCALTPETSYGFEVVDFARDWLHHPLDPWQRWLVIHAGELIDGRLRFEQVLVLVARQNGKTDLLVVLSLFWLYVEQQPMVLGMSVTLERAFESWNKAVQFAENTPDLAREIVSVRRANGEQALEIRTGRGQGRYKIAAANRRGGRGDTVNRLVMDEFREMTHEAWNAAEPSTSAVNEPQVWMISNQGDVKSEVLPGLRQQALAGLTPELAIFEWSAPDGAAPTDPEALAAANPNLGRRIRFESLMGKAVRAEAAGGEQLAGFLTEYQCRSVPLLDPAVDMEAWESCKGDAGLDELRDRVALCLDVSLDELHASLYAAAVDGEKVRVDFVREWYGQTAVREMTAELPALVAKIQPRILGWFPSGPAASAAAALVEREGWPPDDVEMEPIKGAATAVCMGFAEQVRSHSVIHEGHPLLDSHVRAAEKLHQGDGWRFTRRKAGQVDAAYAAAGAVHLARTLPEPTDVGMMFV